ncbi:hypothetical protein ACN28G_05965 [Micromonospora sp. WMMA1923]|uniref:hypothetical protein n=1 Tax=Micromonospora sp. WMMA1923 TaxID=3404125 RepID=UPI003B94017C
MTLALRTGAAVLGETGPYALDDDIIRFYRDLLRPYGDEVDEELARQGRNVPFVDLAERALAATPDPVASPDLLILAYALPDLHPLKTVASHLNHGFGDTSRSFAVSEQGLAAPFTALRVANAYARSGRCDSLALFVLEQTTFAYREPFAHAHDLLDSGVLMVFDRTGRWTVDGLHTAPSGAATGALLRRLLPAPVAARALLVTGPWTDPADTDVTGVARHRVAPGSYCTSLWRELLRCQRDWAQRHHTLVLCDTDPRHDQTQVAILTQQTAAPPPPAKEHP